MRIVKRISLGQLGASLFCGCFFSAPAGAISFEYLGVDGSFTNTISVGASLRVEDRDPELIGKSNLNPGLCVRRSGDPVFPIEGNTCNSTTDPSLNEAYVAAPGSFSPNGDNGNLNYDKYDFVSGATKLLSELSLRRGGWNLFVRTLGFYDVVNDGYTEFHPDTTFQPRNTERPNEAERASARDFRLLDAYIDGGFEVGFLGDRYLRIRAGDQVINWGESAFLLLNSLNTVNPPDAPLLRLPGFQIAELLQPLGIVSFQFPITTALTLEAFYNYDWEPVEVDPPGTFFSTADIAGATDNRHAILSFGKAPEDPQARSNPENNPSIPGVREGDPAALVSGASRTIFFDEPKNARDHGQYGVSFRYFAENFNNGTEFGFYYLNYHSRFPIISARAAEETCIGPETQLIAQVAIDCMAGTGSNGLLNLAGEPLPVDTVRLFFEYPEDINLFALSWNTTLGDWSFNGEYAFRNNLPFQIQSTDLIFAALQPAFPRNNVADNPVDPQALLPNRRAAVPDFIETIYRGNDVQPGDEITGFERFKVGQFNMQFTRTIGAGANWFNADQVVFLLELGFQHILDFPELDEFQLNSSGVNTAVQPGADGTGGNLANPGTLTPAGNLASCTRACRQNPTAGSTKGLVDDFSWGLRAVLLPRYQSLFWNVNIEPLLAVFADIDGTSPGPGGNFVENRLQILAGLRFDYFNAWSGELRYTAQTSLGDDQFIDDRDRDILSAFIAYEF